MKHLPILSILLILLAITAAPSARAADSPTVPDLRGHWTGIGQETPAAPSPLPIP
jgi:hypothetical protein